MNSHECAPVVRLLPNSPRETEQLIEEWVFNEGHFQPPIRISASIVSDDSVITGLKVMWVWDYDLATPMNRTIGIGLAIGLNIRLYNISNTLGFKWNPTTPSEVTNTFSSLLSLIPALNKHIVIKR